MMYDNFDGGGAWLPIRALIVFSIIRAFINIAWIFKSYRVIPPTVFFLLDCGRSLSIK